VPAAFIELHPGTTLTEQEVIANCRGGLASFKVRRYVRSSPSGVCEPP
jgi:hypothetical protein